MLPKTLRKGLAALAAPMTLFVLATCGGGGGGSDPDPNNITISGVVDDGGNSSPIPNATCRFVDTDGQTHDTDTCDQNGIYQLSVPSGVEGFIYCSPPSVSSLSLATFSSTAGVEPGGVIDGENVTPATTVTADIIQHEDPVDPKTRKGELLNAIVTKTDPNLEIVVAMATRLYRAMLAQQINTGFSSGGDGGDGNGASDSDVGGASGEAGDGADFSPLAGAQCRFVVGNDPLSAEPAYPSALADFLADGELDRPDLATLADDVTAGLDYDADEVQQAFNTVFSQGMGEAYTATADAAGHYFLPVPANMPGFVQCTPQGRQYLGLTAYVPGHSPGAILDDQDVTPATTVFSYVIAPQIDGDLATIKENFLADIAGLEVLLSGDNLPDGPLTAITLGTDPLPANPEVGLVAFTVTALYNAFYKNGLDVDVAKLIAHLVENQAVNPDYLVSLGLPADQAGIVETAIDAAATVLDTTLAKALSTARVNVTVMNADNDGVLVEGALIDIPDLEAPAACEGCGTTTDSNGQLTLTLSGIAREAATPMAVTVSSVAGFEPVSADTKVVAFATVDVDVALSSATTFDLTVQGGGEGGGSITSAPAGIDCTTGAGGQQGDCSEPYVAGTEVVLTATPDADSTFTGWSGGCSDAGPSCAVTLEENTSLTAFFEPRCADDAYAIETATTTFAAEEGSSSVAVTAPHGCPWSATTSADWIDLVTGNGSGDGAISYTVSANTGVSRSATISMGDSTHTVTQDAGPCTFSIPESRHDAPASGESYDIPISAAHEECYWTADESIGWVDLSPTSGTGSLTVRVTVSPNNSDRSRSDTIGFAGRPHLISQAADTISPSISITTPTTNAAYTTTSGSLSIAGTAADNVTVTQVTWSNNNEDNGTCSGTSAWSAGPITLSTGVNVITVTAGDAAGNSATDTLSVTYSPSLKQPTLVEPDDGAVMDNGCTSGENLIEWDFSWEPVPGATQYEILIQRPSWDPQDILEMTEIVSTPSFQYSQLVRIPLSAHNMSDWIWRVRAGNGNNEWSEWSQENGFTLEPEDTDCQPK